MDKKMIELLDSAQALNILALLIAQKAINNDKAKEVALRYMDDAETEVWKARQALREIILLMNVK